MGRYFQIAFKKGYANSSSHWPCSEWGKKICIYISVSVCLLKASIAPLSILELLDFLPGVKERVFSSTEVRRVILLSPSAPPSPRPHHLVLNLDFAYPTSSSFKVVTLLWESNMVKWKEHGLCSQSDQCLDLSPADSESCFIKQVTGCPPACLIQKAGVIIPPSRHHCEQ